MPSFAITPLTDHTGAEVIGLDFTQPIDIETRAGLNHAFAERHVLVMRDQRFTPEQFKAAAQLFGELQPHDKKERHVAGHPDVCRNLPPPGIHPLVRTHPFTGRKCLYVSKGECEGIEGMAKDEALALIDELMRHATQKKYEYRHKWRHGDWVLWDNRSVMHQANPDYDMTQRRYLYRLLLEGETPV